MPAVYISCNGCEDGRLSSARVESFFAMNNYTVTRHPAEADLIVFYACGLTEESEKESLRILEKLRHVRKPDSQLVVWGCLTRINPGLLAKVYSGPLIGPKDLGFFETLPEKIIVPIRKICANALLPRESIDRQRIQGASGFVRCLFSACRRLEENHVFWVHALRGCSHSCTYCSDRCAWGSVSSRPIDVIVSEFETGLTRSYSRFCLIGSDLGAYGEDIGVTLIDLLERLVRINGRRDYSIILPQMNPFYLRQTHHDLEKVFDSGRIAAFGCQVQSGSNRILRLMGRKYTAEEWMKYMLDIRRKFPKIELETHLLTGFPTETEEDFNATMNLLNRIFLDGVVVFKFSPRPHVPASHFAGQIPEKTRNARWRKLMRKATLNVMARRIQRSTTHAFPYGTR